jgi:hypothetical protein
VGVKTQVLRHAVQAEKLARRALHNPEVMARARVRIWRTMLVGGAIGAGLVSLISMVRR